MNNSEYETVRKIAQMVMTEDECRDAVSMTHDPEGMNVHDVLFGLLLMQVDEDDELSHLEAADVSDVSWEVVSDYMAEMRRNRWAV